jgi:hypothetical protein
MPGQLRSDAECPRCGYPLECLVDETCQRVLFGVRSTTVKRWYYHGKPSPKARRAPRHMRVFDDLKIAQAERRALEA